MSKETDLIAFADLVRSFTALETPSTAQWNENPTVLEDVLRYLGPAFTDTDAGHDTLATRFDAEHDVDGKHTPPSEWVRDPNAPIFVSSAQFQFVGNRLTDYAVADRIRAQLATNVFVIAAIKTIAFDVGPNRTTVTLDASVLSSALQTIDRALVRQSTAKIEVADLMPILGTLVQGVTIDVVQTSPTQATINWRHALIGGVPLQVAPIPLPVSTAAGNGAGRLDTGAWVAHTPYAVYLCTNDLGTAATITASLSFSGAPTVMPAAYTRAAYIGAILTDAVATNLVPMRQDGRRVARRSTTPFSTPGSTGVGDFLLPSYRTIDLSLTNGLVPPGVRTAILETYFSTNTAGLRSLFMQPLGQDALAETVAAVNLANEVAITPGRRQGLDANRRCQFSVLPPAFDGAVYSIIVSVIGWEDWRVA